ncbi:MAG: formylglycine-generating enzyme family protein [Candidatus Tectimicrobiota bacterium]
MPTLTPTHHALSSPAHDGLPTDFPAPWACDWGEDAHGLWMSFSYHGNRQALRWIAPGAFWMGSPAHEAQRGENETRHRVLLTQGFWLAETPCTQALWQAVMGHNPSRFQGEDRPVENVSWDEAQTFLTRLNDIEPALALRLPTEAEWEYACRAGTDSPFWFGSQITPEQVNYDGNYPYAGGSKGRYREETVPVYALPCNAWGLYQMHGNVWEWCQDWYAAYPVTSAESPAAHSSTAAEPAAVDPVGAAEGVARVLRGGSWIFQGRFARSARRGFNSPGYRDVYYGFRLARGQARPAGGAPEAPGGSGAQRAGQTLRSSGGQAQHAPR